MKPKLKDVKPEVTSAAWLILRWCVASCTAHIEPIESGPQLIRNLGKSQLPYLIIPSHVQRYTDSSWRQYRLTVGAPDAEDKFKKAVDSAKTTSANAKKYPIIYVSSTRLRFGLPDTISGVPRVTVEKLAFCTSNNPLIVLILMDGLEDHPPRTVVQDYGAWKSVRPWRLPREGLSDFHGLLCSICERSMATICRKSDQMYSTCRSDQPTREIRFQ